MGRAKGTAFFDGEEYVKQTYGPEAWARILAAMPAAAAEVIIETLGRFAAEQDLTRIHRVFLRMASPAFVLERATNLWRRFFDSGHCEVKPAERGVDGLLIDSAIVHDVFCRSALCRFAIRWA